MACRSEWKRTSIGFVFFRENSTLSFRPLMDRLAMLVPRTRLFSCWLLLLSWNDWQIQRVTEEGYCLHNYLLEDSSFWAFLTWNSVSFRKNVNWSRDACCFCSGERTSVTEAGSVMEPSGEELSTDLLLLFLIWNETHNHRLTDSQG